jgi:hypothetical protein
VDGAEVGRTNKQSKSDTYYFCIYAGLIISPPLNSAKLIERNALMTDFKAQNVNIPGPE